MSDTIRTVGNYPGDKSWGIGNPLFDKLFPRIKSEKHQRRDRGNTNTLKRNYRFTKHGRNSRYNLQRKVLQLQFVEQCELTPLKDRCNDPEHRQAGCLHEQVRDGGQGSGT